MAWLSKWRNDVSGVKAWRHRRGGGGVAKKKGARKIERKCVFYDLYPLITVS
jgi:hypothetical protein